MLVIGGEAVGGGGGGGRDKDSEIAWDKGTSSRMKEIAHSITDFLRLAVDCPSEHNNGWMPLLDLAVRKAEDNSIDYIYYEKPSSSKFLMMKQSAMPFRTKVSCLTQEVRRRLKNTRARMPWEVKASILTKMLANMKRSG